MLRNLYDQNYSSGQVASGTGSAFQTGPFTEAFDAKVIDNRINPAPNIPLGTLFVEQMALANGGDAFYVPEFATGIPRKLFTYGALTEIPLPPVPPNVNTPGAVGATQGQQNIRIRQVGTCLALCTTGGGIAIGAGTLLTSDGLGNLTPFAAASAAPTPTITPFGTTGGTTYTYKLAAVSNAGVASALGTAASTTTGNATLSGTNGNIISFTPVADAAYYIVVRTVGGAAQGVIGTVPGGGSSFTDIGQGVQANTSATVYFPTLTAPNAPTVVQVSGAVAGTTSNTYKITAVGSNGVYSAESTGTALATSNAVLSVANGNKITWTAVTGAAYYLIDRTAAGGTPSTTGIIGASNAPTAGFVDYGQAATAYAAVTTPTPTPPAGLTYAVARGTLAASITTPTLVSVSMGGF
ncbi:MAG: hypothetical protein WCD38_11875 [Candidatus Tumulicola sp.]